MMDDVDVVLLVLRGFSFVAGALLCYGSLFIYEDEERRIQNALEDWWIRLDDMREHLTRRHIAYLRTINDMVASWLTRLFGKKFFSVRALGVSACLSIASLMMIMLLFHASVESSDLNESPVLRVLRGALLLVGLVVLQPVLLRTAWEHWIIFASAVSAPFLPRIRSLSGAPLIVAAVLCGVIAVRHVTSEGPEDQLLFGFVMATALVVGTLTDYCASIVLRKIVAYRQPTNALRIHLGAIVAQVATGLMVILFPLIGGLIVAGGHGSVLAFIGLSIMLSAATNFFIFGLSMLFACAGLTLFVHRGVWPLAQRPLYLLARLRLFASMSRKVALFGVGTAAVMVAFGQGDDMLRALRALVKAS
jgi:hypothetical protein